MKAGDARKELQRRADRERAAVMQSFFKTGPGQYGEGDFFIGVPVPEMRIVAKKFGGLSLDQVKELLYSRVHEERLVALLILVLKYASSVERKQIVEFYLANIKQVNNWDLVDSSAPYILGAHLMGGDRKLLYRLARSESIWERRIAIVSTLHFIRKNDLADTFRISEMLLADRHDLIHKAAGWMLREAGKKDPAALEAFLAEHCRAMPRTMLRYAIERLPEAKRRRYLKS